MPQQSEGGFSFGGLLLALFAAVFLFGTIINLSSPQKPPSAPLPPASFQAPVNAREKAEELVNRQSKDGRIEPTKSVHYFFRWYRWLPNSSSVVSVELGEMGGDRYFYVFDMKATHPFFPTLQKCLKGRPAELSLRKKPYDTGGVEMASDWLDLKSEQAVEGSSL